MADEVEVVKRKEMVRRTGQAGWGWAGRGRRDVGGPAWWRTDMRPFFFF